MHSRVERQPFSEACFKWVDTILARSFDLREPVDTSETLLAVESNVG